MGPRCLYSEDIDGDGDMDVISNSSGANIDWWENEPGSGILWERHPVGDGFESPRCVYSEDIDGDGDMDILGAAISAAYDDISWWENTNGTGTSWLKHVVHYYPYQGARSVYAVDMDNDGDMDVLGVSPAECEVNWFENVNGSGTSWRNHLIADNVVGATSIHSADINGDGIMDAIGASGSWDFVAWWDVLTYAPEGYLMSSVLDTDCSPVWGSIDWSGIVYMGTSIGFQVRSSNYPDSTAMGPWSDTLYTPFNLEGILTDGEQYVQYMVILETSNPDLTPVLYDVTLTWNPVGISGEEGGPHSFEVLPFYPNPSASAPTVRFGVPEPASVSVSIFDLSGRLVSGIEGEYPAGYQSLQIEGLLPGIYFCRMTSGDFEATQRFVVVE
jgi:hypothetical protein